MAKKKQSKSSNTGQQFLSDEKFIKQRMRLLEKGPCYITENIKNHGEGYVVVSRKHTGGRISMVCYLLDVWCCGVKDSFYRLRIEDYEFDDFIRQINGKECSYIEAHNWVFGAIGFAEDAGIKPDKSFNLTQYFLDEDNEDVPLMDFDFGKDGKYLLVVQSQQEANRYLPLLRKNLDVKDYTYVIGDNEYYDEFEEDEYDDSDDDSEDQPM